MAIVIKSGRDIELMRMAGKIAAGARSIARQMIEPGVSTKAINKEVFNFIKRSGAEPTFLGYCGSANVYGSRYASAVITIYCSKC